MLGLSSHSSEEAFDHAILQRMKTDHRQDPSRREFGKGYGKNPLKVFKLPVDRYADALK